jgi:hypothetical protein
MAAQLSHVGFEHYVALAPDEAQCRTLVEHMPEASCVWTTEPQMIGVQYGVEGLWIQRYYACTSLARAGLNVLMMDLDTIIYRDPYPDLHSPPLDTAKLIHLKEGFANGGLFYMQNVDPEDSPAFWIHSHVLATAQLIANARQNDGAHMGTMMDQALLNDNLNDAGCNSSVYDMPSVYVTGDSSHGHKFWKTMSPVFGKTAGELSVRVDGQRWYCEPLSGAPSSYSVASSEPTPCETITKEIMGEALSLNETGGSYFLRQAGRVASACEGHWSAYRRDYLTEKPLMHLQLRIPLDAVDPAPGPEVSRTMEIFAVAPEWTFGHCDSAHAGWQTSALVHLVACSADWSGKEWTHVGRRALMVAAGAWRREGNLRQTFRFLTVNPLLALTANVTTKDEASAFIVKVIAVAASLDRTPVLPGFDCESPWIKRESWSSLGVFDRSVLKFRGLCFPSPGGPACSYRSVIGAYEHYQLHHGGLRKSDTVVMDSFDQYPAAFNTPLDPQTQQRIDAFRGHCPRYYDNGPGQGYGRRRLIG